MPWKEVNPMDQKILFIGDYLRGDADISQLCQRYGISRKTGYKWIGRYRSDGVAGLDERSRRPLNVSPTPYAICQVVVQLRARRYRPGPKKIQALLGERFADELVPSKTTIYNILRRAGLIETRRRKPRVGRSAERLEKAGEPNQVWSADYKGQWKTADSRWCYPLTVMDHASRYLLGCHGLPGTRLKPTQAVFERLFRRYGLPQRIRTDNGVPFASLGVAGLSQLSVWWIRLGIVPERIAPGQPQQNGRHERMHRTLKGDLGRQPAANLRAQQRHLNAFCREYNEQRPHEALSQRCPQACYRPSPRAYPSRLPELQYLPYFELNKVSHNGLLYWRGLRIYAGYLLAGQVLGLEQVGADVWDVYFGPVRLGAFDRSKTKGRLDDYITLV